MNHQTESIQGPTRAQEIVAPPELFAAAACLVNLEPQVSSSDTRGTFTMTRVSNERIDFSVKPFSLPNNTLPAASGYLLYRLSVIRKGQDAEVTRKCFVIVTTGQAYVSDISGFISRAANTLKTKKGR
jgi:hypothetical protein